MNRLYHPIPFTGSLQGTASYASTASYFNTDSLVNNNQTSSMTVLSSSFSLTSSFVTGSGVIGTVISSSYAISSSLSQTSSYSITSSYALIAQSIQGGVGTDFGTVVTASGALTRETSSYALTASYLGSAVKYEQLYVSSSITQSLNYNIGMVTHYAKIVADVGVAPYTASFVLTSSNVNAGSKTSIRLEITSSSNPHVIFYSNTTSSLYLLTVSGIQGTIGSVASEFVCNGTNWELLYAGYDN